MKLQLIGLLIIITLVQANLSVRKHEAQDHQLFDNSWVGTSDSACNKACKNAYGNICGFFTKECCRSACDKPHWWSPQTCPDSNNIISLNCSVLQSLTGGWRGNSCDASCSAQGGKICGDTLKQCCVIGCDVGTFATTCLQGKDITSGLTCV